jgi:hypothetical protein
VSFSHTLLTATCRTRTASLVLVPAQIPIGAHESHENSLTRLVAFHPAWDRLAPGDVQVFHGMWEDERANPVR